MNLPLACHPERSGGGRAGAAQSKDPGGPFTHSTLSDYRGPSTAFPPAFARRELRSG